MIVLLEKRLLIVTPPKCASTSLHKMLCTVEQGGMYVAGPSGSDGRIDKHTAVISVEFESFRKAVVVRHPLDRLVSLWHHCVRFRAYEYAVGTWDFAEYVKRVQTGEMLDWFFWWSLSRHIGDMKPDIVLRCESLQSDLEAIGLCPSPFLRENVEYRRPWKDYYRDGRCGDGKTAEEWAEEDAERFGYDLDIAI